MSFTTFTFDKILSPENFDKIFDKPFESLYSQKYNQFTKLTLFIVTYI